MMCAKNALSLTGSIESCIKEGHIAGGHVPLFPCYLLEIANVPSLFQEEMSIFCVTRYNVQKALIPSSSNLIVN